MSRTPQTLTGRERTFRPDEIIVSKTDPKGRITYANEVFIRISGYAEDELLGQPHCLVRHPDMPRCVFQFMWDTLKSGREIFAYVVNRSKNGDHYWVFAHVTPTFDDAGTIVGFHSNRRVPDPRAVTKVREVYEALCRQERRFDNPRAQVAAGMPALRAFLDSHQTTYEELVFAL